MELSVKTGMDPITYFQRRIEQPNLARIDVWNENRSVMFDMARTSNDLYVKRAFNIWNANLKESIDDPRYGDELFDALFCAQYKMKGKTPGFYYKHMWAERDGRIIYESCVLRKDMCGHKKWDKISKLTFDGRTLEFRVKNEELGYPVTVL